jgi:hypothetical protein
VVPSDLWEIIRAKTYGATEVLFMRHAAATASSDEAGGE